MEKEINLNAEAAIEYVKSNVKNYDVLEISYNRVFVPGEVLDVSAVENDGIKSLRLLIKMNGKTIKQKSRLVKKEAYSFGDTTINCVVIEGENTNYLDKIGLYKCEYLFNEYYGYVQLNYYKPGGESVKVLLKTTNFR